MKLQNIIIALSAVLAFTACSKDDDNNPDANLKAKLIAKVVTNGATTKATDPLELAGEANINTLTAIVFDTDSNKIGVLAESPNVSHTYQMENIPSKTGSALVILIANAPATVYAITTYAELQALLADLSAQTQNSLTMSSPLIAANNLVEGANDLGEIILTRIAARIDIDGVKTNFTKSLLVGRRVKITSVSFENVKSKSKYFSEADWGKVMVAGNYTTLAKKAYTENTPVADLGHSSYVMENLGEETGKTTVVIEATLEENGQSSQMKKIFRSVINANGKLKGVDHNYVRRNHVYQLGLTFGDNSFDPPIDPIPDPDPQPTEGTLDVTVTVVNWGQVEQPVITD